MAASTITRDTWVNDTGTAATPAADGTLLNNAALQNNIYARIDAMFAGAGAYATLSIGGLLSAEGFGSHLFSAGGAGGQAVIVRNTSAGATNFAVVYVGNDGASTAGQLFHTSSTYTTGTYDVQDALHVVGSRVGGVSIVSSHASGTIRFYAGGTTERARLTAGQLFIGDTSNADMTVGLTINQGASTANPLLAFKNGDVTHGITSGTYGVETDTFGAFRVSGGGGGLEIDAYSETVSTANSVFKLRAVAPSGSGDTTKSIAAMGFFSFEANEWSAGTFGGITANENIAVFSTGAAVRFILDADGDSHQDVGTAWTNFDDYEDHELLSALSAGVSRKGDPLRRAFSGLLKKHRATLEANGIVTFNKDGHHFVNWSRLNMLKVGAIRQNAMRIAAQAQEIATLKRRLLALEGA
jgi:hypothetical protein